MFHPLSQGDIIGVGGEQWVVSRSAYGWYLHSPAAGIAVHPSIHSIDGMMDFITAIYEWELTHQ